MILSGKRMMNVGTRGGGEVGLDVGKQVLRFRALSEPKFKSTTTIAPKNGLYVSYG
jgi:hypothetical protein